MDDTTTIETRDALLTTLRMVSIRGELDFGWTWDAEPCFRGPPGPSGGGWLVWVEYTRPDRDTGIVGRGRSRPFFVPVSTNVRAVIGTAFAAIKLTLEHELHEGFHFGDHRVFDPHGPLLEERA